MPLAALLWSFVSWLLRDVVVKFLVLGAIFFAVAELTPLVIEALGTFTNTQSLTAAFSGIPSGVYYFLNFFALDVGIPLLISAHVARFVIRRLPVIG